MKVDPHKIKKEAILSRQVLLLIVGISSLIGLVSLYYFSQHYMDNVELENVRSQIFALIASVDLIYIFSFKSLSQPVFKIKKFWLNYSLFLGVVYGFILLFAAIYWPPLQNLLGLRPLSLHDWLWIIGIGVLIALFAELIKIIRFWLDKREYAKSL